TEWPGCSFDLSTNTSTYCSDGAIPFMQPLSNGWVRIAIRFSNGVPGGCCFNNPKVSIWLKDGFDYQGQGTNNETTSYSGIYVRGPQLELGYYPTSYIPTTSSTGVTRAADSAIVNDIGWLNQTAWSSSFQFDRSGYEPASVT